MAAELHIADGPDGAVVLTGEIDTHTSPSLEERLSNVADVDSIVLDLAAVTFISSAGLTALLTAQARLQAAGGSLVVQNPTAAVARMISLSGLDGLLGSQ